MSRQVAFLRAVNVGGRVITMDRLRRLFEDLRFGGVETFIASGNVVFDHPGGRAPAIEKRIEAHLETALGYEVLAFVRTTAELSAIVDRIPADAGQRHARGHTLYVAFLKSPLSAALRRRVEALANDVDQPSVSGREIYWVCRGGFRESALSRDALGKALGLPTTMRNINTVRRLVAKYPA
jgi:uncharacterized protein (DUF1697 family)